MTKIGTKIFDLVQQAVHREKIPLVQMKEISLRAKKLSKIYINHSVRATSVTILDKCRFEARHISEHQNESSIRSYASKTNDAVKQAIYFGLSSAKSKKAEDEQHIVHASSSSLNCDNRNVSISSAPKTSSTSATVIAKISRQWQSFTQHKTTEVI